MKLTGTNRPRTCHIPNRGGLCRLRARVHCAVPEVRSAPAGGEGQYLHRVSATIARGKRPVPSRTRKLSLSAPMVLRGPLRGRVGRRRTHFGQGSPFTGGPCSV